MSEPSPATSPAAMSSWWLSWFPTSFSRLGGPGAPQSTPSHPASLSTSPPPLSPGIAPATAGRPTPSASEPTTPAVRATGFFGLPSVAPAAGGTDPGKEPTRPTPMSATPPPPPLLPAPEAGGSAYLLPPPLSPSHLTISSPVPGGGGSASGTSTALSTPRPLSQEARLSRTAGSDAELTSCVDLPGPQALFIRQRTPSFPASLSSANVNVVGNGAKGGDLGKGGHFVTAANGGILQGNTPGGTESPRPPAGGNTLGSVGNGVRQFHRDKNMGRYLN